MKRDLDLIRSMLLTIEAAPPGTQVVPTAFGPDIDEDVLGEHAELLNQAGFVEGVFNREAGRVTIRSFRITRLTWAGHEYLNDVKSDTVWSSVKQTARDKGIELSIEIVKTLAVAKAKALLLGIAPV